MADYAPPVPVKIRTARKRHACDECDQWIEPGEKYELCTTPPHRLDVTDVDSWLDWRSHYPRIGPAGQFLLGCAVAAAYRERAERGQPDG